MLKCVLPIQIRMLQTKGSSNLMFSPSSEDTYVYVYRKFDKNQPELRFFNLSKIDLDESLYLISSAVEKCVLSKKARNSPKLLGSSKSTKDSESFYSKKD